MISGSLETLQEIIEQGTYLASFTPSSRSPSSASTAQGITVHGGAVQSGHTLIQNGHRNSLNDPGGVVRQLCSPRSRETRANEDNDGITRKKPAYTLSDSAFVHVCVCVCTCMCVCACIYIYTYTRLFTRVRLDQTRTT